ncbi:Uncharacterized protein PPKH_3358 [Pseudomonas putida]|nr:Uncharacterized protein PPKH_3358 [Pseudomonas putida]
MRNHGFLSRPARVAENPYRSCFQSFTPAERELMRAGAGMRGCMARANAVLPDELCS